jgi:ribosomal protein S18 acetylase RimI-like enzyme
MPSSDSALDNPVYAALGGPHRSLAEWDGRVARYPVDVAPFVGLPDAPSPADWESATRLLRVEPGAVRLHEIAHLPDSLAAQLILPVVQMTAPPLTEGQPAIDDTVMRLGVADVPEMLELAERTEPGPFRARTIELGTYLGIRHDGHLVAMAGERFQVPGWTEISAVCTDPAVRGQGLASRLVAQLRRLEGTRGAGAFLHVLTSNTDAIRLYETLGFTSRAEFFIVVVAPTRT